MDDHRRGETLEQGFGLPPSAGALGGGAELAAMALELDRVRRWTATLLGAVLTVSVLLAHAGLAGS
jgi:hypothetical protein